MGVYSVPKGFRFNRMSYWFFPPLYYCFNCLWIIDFGTSVYYGREGVVTGGEKKKKKKMSKPLISRISNSVNGSYCLRSRENTPVTKNYGETREMNLTRIGQRSGQFEDFHETLSRVHTKNFRKYMCRRDDRVDYLSVK